MKRFVWMLVLVGCGSGAGTTASHQAASTSRKPKRVLPPLAAPLTELEPCYPQDELPRRLNSRWILPAGVTVVSATCTPGRFPRVGWVTVANLEGPKGVSFERSSIWDVHTGTELVQVDVDVSWEAPCRVSELAVTDFDADQVDEIIRVCEQTMDEGSLRKLLVHRLINGQFVLALDLDFGWSSPEGTCSMTQSVTEPTEASKRELVIEASWEGGELKDPDSCREEARYRP